MNKSDIFKICLAIPSLGQGGMERVMSEIIWNFSQKKNVELHLMMFGREREIFYDIPSNITIHKPQFKFNNKFRTLFTLLTLLYVRKEIKKISPDTVLSFGNYWNSLVLLACMGLSYPIYVSDRSKPDKDMGKFQNWLRKKLYPKAAGVIAQTQVAKEIFNKMYKQKNFKVIGNPLREIVIPEQNKREKTVVSVGRLIDTKNFDRLITLFAELNMPDWKLIIIGGDSVKQTNSVKLQQYINENGLNDRVILAGRQKDVDSYLLRGSIFAFTSTSEGFPNVVGEAMQAGLPVVAYDCVAGPADMIEDGKNGFLIPVFDDELFKEKLTSLMNDTPLREKMGKQAKSSIRKFNTETISEMFFNFIVHNK